MHYYQQADVPEAGWRGREREFLRQITLVMGQRNQLIWDIPFVDSLERNRAVYRVPRGKAFCCCWAFTPSLRPSRRWPRPARPTARWLYHGTTDCLPAQIATQGR